MEVTTWLPAPEPCLLDFNPCRETGAPCSLSTQNSVPNSSPCKCSLWQDLLQLDCYLQESLENVVVEFCSFCSTEGMLRGGCGQCDTCHRQRLTLTIVTITRGNAVTTSHTALSWSQGPRLGPAVSSLCVLQQTISHHGAQSVLLSFGDVETCPKYVSKQL